MFVQPNQDENLHASFIPINLNAIQMKTLKVIGIILLVLLVLLLIVGFFLPKDIRVQQSVSIETKANIIYKQVNILNNWQNWTPFTSLDESMSYTNEGPKMGVGAIQKWTAESGNGAMEIVETLPYTQIHFLLDFEGEEERTPMYWTFNEDGDFTMVTWVMEVADLSYPLERYQGLFMKSFMKKVFMDGLTDLKIVCETLPALPSIKLEKMDEFYGLAIYDSAYYDKIADKMGASFGEVMAYLNKQKIQPTGAPFTVYQSWDIEKPFLMNLGLPVSELKKGKGRIQPITFKAGDVAVGCHYGSYDKTGDTHMAIMEYMEEHGLEANGAPWESYVTDPGSESDTSKWLTKIYWPVK